MGSIGPWTRARIDAVRHGGWGLPALVALGALAVRLVYWAVFLRHYVPMSDAAQYDRMARNFAAGHGIADVYPSGHLHATAFRPPLYPGLLGTLYWLFGSHLAVAQATNAVLGAANVLVGARLAQRIGGHWAGVAAGSALALYPPLVAHDVVPLSEPLGLLIMLVLAGFLADRRYDRAAVATGLLVLSRNSAQGLIVAIGLWLVLAVGVRTAVRFAAITVLVVAPWIVRNELRVHAPVVVTSDGFNLAAIYSPEARQSYPRIQFVDPTLDVRFASHWSLRNDEARWDAYLRQRGITGLAQNPARVLTIVSNNAKRLAELTPKFNIPAEISDGRVLRVRNDTLPVFYVITALGVAGLWRYRRSHEARALAGLAVSFILLTLLFVPAPRLRAPLDVACCIGFGLLVAPRSGTGADSDEEVSQRGTAVPASASSAVPVARSRSNASASG
jgi:hypothetical protein